MEVAAGIHAIANARMTRALRSVSSEKGRDPREFALLAYGGAGPVHAVGLAEELGCRTVLVPALAGLFSSLGLLYARPEFHAVRTCHLDARTIEPSALDAVFGELGVGLEGVELVRSAELRYGGQTWEIEIGVGDPADLRAVIAAFEDEHERLYGIRGEDGSPIEMRALRLAALGRSSAVDRLSLVDGFTVRSATRDTALGELPVRTRASVGESPEAGPMLIDEYDTTVVVRPGWTVRRDAATETLILELA
jgi:N-methylhydantoinase A